MSYQHDPLGNGEWRAMQSARRFQADLRHVEEATGKPHRLSNHATPLRYDHSKEPPKESDSIEPKVASNGSCGELRNSEAEMLPAGPRAGPTNNLPREHAPERKKPSLKRVWSPVFRMSELTQSNAVKASLAWNSCTRSNLSALSGVGRRHGPGQDVSQILGCWEYPGHRLPLREIRRLSTSRRVHSITAKQ